jgi:protein ImuA
MAMGAPARPGFSSSSAGAPAVLDRLRRELCAAEAATGLTSEGDAALALGIPAIDGLLGGGLSCGALHEIAAAHETETAAATGFVLALAARQSFPSCLGKSRTDESVGRARIAARSVLWITEDFSLAENGAPYGPGLDGAGIAPERLITVTAAHGRDVLWAMEEALRCRAVGVVIGEMRSRGIDQVMTRRLALAAATGATLGLLLRTTPHDEPSAAATRWIIGAAPSFLRSEGGDERGHGLGPPRLAARLVRNRRGHLGAWIVEWNSVEQRFELATHSEPVAGAAFDRPHRAAVA